MKRCIIIILTMVLMTGVAFAGTKEDLLKEQQQLLQEIDQKRVRIIEINGILKYLAEQEKAEKVESTD